MNIETPFSDGSSANQYAGERGWCIGHFEGQGEIVCPDCREAVWEARPLTSDN
jgi:hypothetical protein